MSAITITKDNFQTEVLSAKGTVLIDFWASWCGPCRMLGPVIEEVAREQEGKVKVGKVNVDENPQLAARFGIRSIPTLILFKNGTAVDQAMGYMPKEKVEAFIGQ